jgi:hypothetical protein
MTKSSWNPYVVGAGIGVLSWIVFVVVNSPIGITTALSQASGVVSMPFLGKEGVEANPYWVKTFPKWDYGTLFLIGTFLGSLGSAIVGKTFRFEKLPSVWQERFGAAVGFRFAAAFLGGIIIMYSARLAGGCTSGHGISGSLQLAVSSWVFFITMFISGLFTARILWGARS